jgi:hypothetical protein
MILIIVTLLCAAFPVSAQIVTTPASATDSPFYGIKLWIEDTQESLTFNIFNKLNLQQEHLQNRLDELQYEATSNNNINTEKLLQKIQIKQLEISQTLSNIENNNCAKPAIGSTAIPTCYISINGSFIKIDDIRNQANTNAQQVIGNLLNDTSMPEQSHNGLVNALNNTILRYSTNIKDTNPTPSTINISANIVQGTYQVNPTYLSILPFTSASILDPNENKWYSISVKNNQVIILDYLNKDTPQYYLYPTSSQMSSFSSIASHINKNGLGFGDKIDMFKLWYGIKKVKNE